MKKRMSPALIGAFVVGAITLTVAALIVFGGGRFFVKKYRFVAFFEGSVFGLSPGAPVVCRGVRVGDVTNIELLSDPKTLDLHIAVFFETEPERISVIGEQKPFDSYKRMQEMIQHGLRAQLEMQSFLTRQLMVVLAFHPNTPIRLTGIETGYPEVPTIRSPMQELLETVERLPLEDIAKSIQNALEGIEEVIHSPEVAESLRALKGTLQATEETMKQINQEIGPLVKNLRGTLRDARKLLRNVDAKVDPLASGMEETLEAARGAIVEAEGTIRNLEGSVREDSPLVVELTRALAELADASRSLRLLADYLEQHPEAILRGKGTGSGGKRE